MQGLGGRVVSLCLLLLCLCALPGVALPQDDAASQAIQKWGCDQINKLKRESVQETMAFWAAPM